MNNEMRAYYDRRAAEYDDWWLGTGRFAERERPGWPEEVAELVELVTGLEPARVLDVACGTGFLTRHLRGDVVGLDQSARMAEIAAEREAFVREARRVARELVVVDAGLRPDTEAELWQGRILNDGSRHRVFKRYFEAAALADELGGGEVLHQGAWFVAVRLT